MKQIHRLLIFNAIFLLAACASTQQQKSCDNFKKGKFVLRSRFDDSYSIIDRNDSTQTETNSKNGQVVTAKIKWTSGCDYELFYLTQTKKSDDTIVHFIQSRPLKTKIIKVAKDYYVFESHIDSVDIKYVDTLRVFNN